MVVIDYYRYLTSYHQSTTSVLTRSPVWLILVVVHYSKVIFRRYVHAQISIRLSTDTLLLPRGLGMYGVLSRYSFFGGQRSGHWKRVRRTMKHYVCTLLTPSPTI